MCENNLKMSKTHEINELLNSIKVNLNVVISQSLINAGDIISTSGLIARYPGFDMTIGKTGEIRELAKNIANEMKKLLNIIET
jgi:HEPN domain-containing protein